MRKPHGQPPPWTRHYESRSRNIGWMPPTPDQRWLADIVLAFRHLQDDGVVWLQDVYDWIRRNRQGLPPNFAAVIRATIYTHSTDSKAYIAGNPDVFRKVAHGGWMLRLPQEDVPTTRDLLTFVLARMTDEELESFADDDDGFIPELERRAEILRQKFGMS